MSANRIKFFKYLTQQPFENLCWAACVAMIARWLYREKKIDMEYVVNKYLSNGKPPLLGLYEHNKTVSRDELPLVFDKNQLTCELHSSYLASGMVKFLIDENCPVLVCLKNQQISYSGHVLIIVGYTPNEYVVHDPYDNNEHGLIKKDHLRKGYAKAYWDESWTNFKRKNG